MPGLPLPKDDHLLFKDTNYVYPTDRRGVKYLIRSWDPASLICDQKFNKSTTLYPRVLCMAGREVAQPQTEGLLQQFCGNWKIWDKNKTEIPWPGWTSHTRRRGEYIRVLVPGMPRARGICVLPSGSTRYNSTKTGVFFIF